MVFLLILIAIRDRHFDLRALAFTAGVALGLSILYSWILSGIFHRVFIRWDLRPIPFGVGDVSFAGRIFRRSGRFRLFNLRWLRVYSTNGKVTWLALFQSHGPEFRQEIRRLGPPGNPVRQIRLM